MSDGVHIMSDNLYNKQRHEYEHRIGKESRMEQQPKGKHGY